MLMEGLEHKDFYIPTIPLWWWLMAARLPGKGRAVLVVASQLWFVYRTGGSKFPVKLSRQWHRLFKYERRTWSREIYNLEKAGLISVERKKGRALRITITMKKSKVAILHKQWTERAYH